MKYRIKENRNGYFTIYEIKTVKSFFGKIRKIEERMDISDLFNGKWYLNGVFKSEKECRDYLGALEKHNSRELIDKIL